MSSFRFVRWLITFRELIEGFIRRQPVFFCFLVLGGLFTFTAFAPVERREDILAPQVDSARMFFGGGQSVGQLFQPIAGLHELIFRVGRRSELSGPLILHLRKEYFGEDVRSAVVFELEPNSENVIFEFDHFEETTDPLLWILEAPHSLPQGYWVYREQDAAAFSEGKAFFSGREISGNYAFSQVGSQPAYSDWNSMIATNLRSFEVESLILFVLVLVLGVSGVFPGTYFRSSLNTWLLVFVAGSLVFHVWMARQLPAIIDEGAYVQDGIQATVSFWPLRDYLTKGPVYVLLLKVWHSIVPHSLEAWRLFSIGAWAGTVLLIAYLARLWGMDKKIQLIAAGLLAFSPGIVAVTTPLLLQVVSTFFAVLAIFLLLKGSRENRVWLVAIAGVVMTLGYLTRSSTVAAGLAGLVLVLLQSRNRWRMGLIYMLSGLISLVSVVVFALATMGVVRTAVLFNLEAVVVGQIQTEMAGGVEPLIRWLTQSSIVLWRGGAAVLAGIVALPFLLTQRFSRLVRVIFAGIWTAVLAVMIYHLRDLGWGLPGAFLITRIFMLVGVFGVPLVALIVPLQQPRLVLGRNYLPWHMLVTCLVWLTALTMLYRGWGIFRATYIVEFLPPAVMMAAVGVDLLVGVLQTRRVLAWGVVALHVAIFWQGLTLMVSHPVSGTMTPEAVKQGGQLIDRFVPMGEEIFTAQPMLTSIAHRPIFRGYSHPGWIRAARVGGLPEHLRSVYFADDTEITTVFENEVKFVVTDQRTNEIYFNDFPERQRILQEDFELLGEVSNDLTEEPFRLYRRR